MSDVNIWRVLWLLIILITTFAVLVIYWPALGRTLDAAIRQDAQYAAGEIADIISLVGAGPDGTRYMFTLPRIDKTDCLQISAAEVKANFRGSATADMIQGVPMNITSLENAVPEKGDQPANGTWGFVNIGCTREARQLMISRTAGQVRFSLPITV